MSTHPSAPTAARFRFLLFNPSFLMQKSSILIQNPSYLINKCINCNKIFAFLLFPSVPVNSIIVSTKSSIFSTKFIVSIKHSSFLIQNSSSLMQIHRVLIQKTPTILLAGYINLPLINLPLASQTWSSLSSPARRHSAS